MSLQPYTPTREDRASYAAIEVRPTSHALLVKEKGVLRRDARTAQREQRVLSRDRVRGCSDIVRGWRHRTYAIETARVCRSNHVPDPALPPERSATSIRRYQFGLAHMLSRASAYA